MKRFAFISDLLFTFFTGGIVTLVYFRHLGLSVVTAFLLAAVCGGLVALSVGCVLQLKRKTLSLKRSDEAQKQKLLLHLALLSDEGKTSYFTPLLSTEEEPAKRFGRLRIFTKTEFYFLKFSLTPVSADEIPSLARWKTGKRKILLCAQIEDRALALCQRLDIEVKTGEWVYERCKTTNALPEQFLGDNGIPTKKRLKLWFARKNAKHFLIGAALVLLFARLTPFYYYYLLLGVGLLFASVFVRVFGYA